MPDIAQELLIGAPPEAVFAAITQPNEITRWWANDVVAEPRAGSLAELRFDNGEIMTMEIIDLVAGKGVSWLVRQAPQYAHLWEGTTITWDLAPRGRDEAALRPAWVRRGRCRLRADARRVGVLPEEPDILP